jgi:hypothetical protein
MRTTLRCFSYMPTTELGGLQPLPAELTPSQWAGLCPKWQGYADLLSSLP